MPGSILHGSRGDQPEAVEKVDPGVVVRDDPRAVRGGQRRLPPRQGRVQAGEELAALRLEPGPLLGSEPHERLEDRRGDRGGVRRIQRVMRVPLGMHVAPRAVDRALGDPQHRDAPRGVDVPGLAAEQIAVAGALQERLDPRIAFDAVADEKVGAAELDHQARPDLDVVRILVASREDVDLDEVAADGLRERLQVRQRGDDANLPGGVAALGQGAERPRDRRPGRAQDVA